MNSSAQKGARPRALRIISVMFVVVVIGLMALGQAASEVFAKRIRPGWSDAASPAGGPAS